MEGHHEQENTLNQLLVEMDGKSRQGSTKCTPESSMCKKCSTQYKMYAREFHVQKVLYTTQNVRLRVPCAKSALYNTKCTPESSMCKKCSIQHKMYA